MQASNIFIIVRLIGIILVGATCLFLTDLKKIIAFSSVAHIGFSILFLRIKTQSRVIIGVMILLAHGFRSSGIFFMVYISFCFFHLVPQYSILKLSKLYLVLSLL